MPTQNISLTNTRNFFSEPVVDNTLGIGGALVITAIAYKLVFKNAIENRKLTHQKEIAAKAVVTTGMFLTGACVYLIAGKVASNLTMLAITAGSAAAIHLI
jgi:hypothetical protein